MLAYHKKWLLLGAAFAIALILGLSASGETAVVSNGSFAQGATADLINGGRVPSGLGSYGYGSRVGGIAFGAIAQPNRADLELLGLEYDASGNDGTRLIASVRDAAARKLACFAPLA